MAKCVGSVHQWKGDTVPSKGATFLVENVREGEAAIKKTVDEFANHLLLEIASDYTRIKQAALGDDEFVLDSRQIQDGIVEKLKSLIDQTNSAIKCISSANNLIASTKHAYFIQYTYGFIEKLQQLSQTVGRLSEIDQKLYMEEQRKLLVSDESIAIHALTSIWTAMLEVLEGFCRQAKFVFITNDGTSDELGNDENDDSQDYNYLDDLEFSTSRNMVARIILMDLIISSWIKFNRLVKYDDLVKSIPFLCPCHMKLFLRILEGAGESASATQSIEDKTPDELILSDLLSLILDHERKPSLQTMSVRRPNVVPTDPCYASVNRSDLAYFLLWHLHALCPKVRSASGRRMLANCQKLMEKSFIMIRESFICDATIRRLSPHQEERYKLLFHMMNVWCERHTGQNHNAILLNLLFEFAHSIDSLANLETKYFNNSDFSLNDSTLFQLCAKLMSETVPTYTPDGRTQAQNETTLSLEQRQLVATWNVLLDEHVENRPPIASDSVGLAA